MVSERFTPGTRVRNHKPLHNVQAGRDGVVIGAAPDWFKTRVVVIAGEECPSDVLVRLDGGEEMILDTRALEVIQ